MCIQSFLLKPHLPELELPYTRILKLKNGCAILIVILSHSQILEGADILERSPVQLSSALQAALEYHGENGVNVELANIIQQLSTANSSVTIAKSVFLLFQIISTGYASVVNMAMLDDAAFQLEESAIAQKPNTMQLLDQYREILSKQALISRYYLVTIV